MDNNILWNDIDAIIFDMDGVITDTEPVINEAGILTLKQYGINAKPEDFIPFIGAGDDKYITGVAEKYGIKYDPELKKKLYENYFKILPQKIKLFPGVKELISTIKKIHKKVAIATAADLVKLKANLDCSGLSIDLFDCIITGDDILKKKPDPEIYLITAQKLKIAPDKCCVIEDALNGIESAKSAGMKCVAVSNSFSVPELITKQPDKIVSNLFEIVDELLNI
jgi:cytidine deaminase